MVRLLCMLQRAVRLCVIFGVLRAFGVSRLVCCCLIILNTQKNWCRRFGHAFTISNTHNVLHKTYSNNTDSGVARGACSGVVACEDGEWSCSEEYILAFVQSGCGVWLDGWLL